jgi:hypothetical protein
VVEEEGGASAGPGNPGKAPCKSAPARKSTALKPTNSAKKGQVTPRTQGSKGEGAGGVGGAGGAGGAGKKEVKVSVPDVVKDGAAEEVPDEVEVEEELAPAQASGESRQAPQASAGDDGAAGGGGGGRGESARHQPEPPLTAPRPPARPKPYASAGPGNPLALILKSSLHTDFL